MAAKWGNLLFRTTPSVTHLNLDKKANMCNYFFKKALHKVAISLSPSTVTANLN